MATREKAGTRAEERRTFYDADELPILGIKSYPHQASLKQGWWNQLSGVRLNRWAAYVKDGDVKLTSGAIHASGTFRGAGSLRSGLVSASNPTLFAAYHQTTTGYIYTSTNGTSFTEKSAASGEFGATRFTTATSADPWFYMQGATDRFIPDPNYGVLGQTFLCIQHNGNSPRIYSPLYDVLGVCDEISTPQGSSLLTSIPTFPAYLLVNTTAEMAHSTSGGSIVTAEVGTTPNAYATVTATNPTQGHYGRITFTTAMSLGTAAGVLTSRQIVMLMQSPTVNILDKYAIKIGDGTAQITVYDPTDSVKNQAPTITPADASGKLFWVGFSLDTIDGWDVASAGLSAVTQVDFYWAAASEAAATYTLRVFAICGSGKAPGGRRHLLTYMRKKIACESKGLRVENIKPELISNLGGATSVSGYIPGGMRIPNLDDRIYVNYELYFQNTSTAEMQKGTDSVVIYAKDKIYDPDQNRWYYERNYTYVTSYIVASYVGSWSFTGGSALGVQTTTDSTLLKNLSFKAPDSATLPIPSGKAMVSANNRLYVASRPTTMGFSTLYVSDQFHPGRFRVNAKVYPNGQFDPTSGTTHQLDDEDIMAMVAMSGQFQGTSNVYVLTDKTIWMVGRDVNRIERVASVGTLSPMSVVEYEGTIYFLSSDRRWLAFTPGQSLRDIGNDVQDKLNSIPGGSDVSTSRLYRVSAGAADQRIRLAYGVTGSTNPRVLVYDILGDRIESDDRPTDPFTVEQFIDWVASGIKGLYAFSSDLEFYQYEQPSSSASSAVTLTTGEFRIAKGRRLSVKRAYIRGEDQASVTATASVNYYKGSATARTATKSLDVSDDRLYKYFDTWSTTGDRMGTSARLSFTATMVGGKFLFELGAELGDLGPGIG